MKSNIVDFTHSEPTTIEPWPTGFEGLIFEAQLATDLAFDECVEQLEIVKAAAYFERQGDRKRTEDLRGVAARKAVGVVEGLIEAQGHLGRARRGAIRKLQDMRARITAGNKELDRAAAAVIDWSEDQPASELLEACRVIAEWLKTAAPETGAGNSVTALATSKFDKSDLRARAQTHGADARFLERATQLLFLA